MSTLKNKVQTYAEQVFVGSIVTWTSKQFSMSPAKAPVLKIEVFDT